MKLSKVKRSRVKRPVRSLRRRRKRIVGGAKGASRAPSAEDFGAGRTRRSMAARKEANTPGQLQKMLAAEKAVLARVEAREAADRGKAEQAEAASAAKEAILREARERGRRLLQGKMEAEEAANSQLDLSVPVGADRQGYDSVDDFSAQQLPVIAEEAAGEGERRWRWGLYIARPLAEMNALVGLRRIHHARDADRPGYFSELNRVLPRGECRDLG